MKILYAICALLELGAFSMGLAAGQPPVPPAQVPPAQAAASQQAQQAAPAKVSVKVINHSRTQNAPGYNATITYHYYLVPEKSDSKASVILPVDRDTTLDLFPNTPFSYALTSESAKTADIQVNPGEYASGSYEIRPPAAPLVIQVARSTTTSTPTQTTTQTTTSTQSTVPAQQPTAAAPAGQPMPPMPPARP